METTTTQPSTPRKWHQIWLHVWGNPGVEAFYSILKEPDHSAGRGFTWIAVVSLISAVVLSFGTVSLLQSAAPNIWGNFVITLICQVILTPLFAVIGVIISTGIYHLLSRLFGSTGTWSDLAFCMSSVYAPSSLIGGILTLPFLLFTNLFSPSGLSIFIIIVAGLISVVFGIYAIILNVNAIRAAEQIGTGQAIGTILAPIVIVVLLSCCLLLLLYPAFRR